MNWTGTLLFLIASVAVHRGTAEDQDSVSDQDSNKQNLNSNLRSALLQVLTDLENESDNEYDDDDRVVERAHASAITIFAKDLNISSDSTPKPPEGETVPEPQFLIMPSNSSEQEDEHFITSASNSFVSESGGSLPTTTVQKEPTQLQQTKGGFKNLNSLSYDESKKSGKVSVVEKFSIGKNVEEPFEKTFVKPLQNDIEDNQVVYVKSFKTQNENKEDKVVTEKPVEVSTEENEAKIEQVQFFMAPLVAAFTVHQDETGQPKKVEPIYKTEADPEKPQAPLQPQSTELRQKQLILEQELQKLRQQQNDLLGRTSHQFDPIFTEPDRSVVTKLAAIDPSQLLNVGSGPVLNKFTANEAIMPLQLNPVPSEDTQRSNGVSLVPSISFDPLVEAGKLPENAKVLPNKEPTGFHSFVKLPTLPTQTQQVFNQDFNLQPVQSHTGFVQPQLSSFNAPGDVRFINHQPQRQEIKPASFSIVPAQQPFPPKHELGIFSPQNIIINNNNNNNNNNNRFLRQENSLLQPPGHSFLTIPQQNFNQQQLNYNQQQQLNFNQQQQLQNFNQQQQQQQQNRFLRNQHRFAPQNVNVQQSIQPFGNQFLKPHLLSQNNRFLRSNQEGNFGVNQNAFQRPLLQHYKYSSPFGFSNRPFH